MTDRGQVVVLVVVVIALFLAFLVGLLASASLSEDVENDLHQQLANACNEKLPGDNWSVANRSLSVSDLEDVRNVSCSRGGDVRQVRVNVSIEVSN